MVRGDKGKKKKNFQSLKPNHTVKSNYSRGLNLKIEAVLSPLHYHNEPYSVPGTMVSALIPTIIRG